MLRQVRFLENKESGGTDGSRERTQYNVNHANHLLNSDADFKLSASRRDVNPRRVQRAWLPARGGSVG